MAITGAPVALDAIGIIRFSGARINECGAEKPLFTVDNATVNNVKDRRFALPSQETIACQTQCNCEVLQAYGVLSSDAGRHLAPRTVLFLA
jgi:hypothetical protein